MRGQRQRWVALLLVGMLGVPAPALVTVTAPDMAPAWALDKDPRRRASVSIDARVREAIEGGIAYLYALMDKGAPRGRIVDTYPVGIRALAVYALLEAGTPVDSPVVQDLFAQMEELKMHRVYSVAIYVFALDALRRKVAESGGKPSARTRKRMARMLRWIVGARSIPRGVWGYEHIGKNNPFEWVDFSNTQFAVLALQVGLRNDIDLGDKVFKEIIFGLEKSTLERVDGPGELPCTGGGWWTDSGVPPTEVRGGRTAVPGQHPITLSRGGFTLSVDPIDWPYKPTWNDGGGAARFSRYSMVAAATSSLMVAREGLARRGRLKGEELAKVDRMIASGVLSLYRGFHSLAPAVLGTLFRNYYYDLYSFEKAMDLGGIIEFGGIDWYHEQALMLISAQRDDGGWGTPTGTHDEYDTVCTAFALLFLVRATRNLRVEPPEPIITGKGGNANDGIRGGRMFLPSLEGMIRLDELFGQLTTLRTEKYLTLAAEVIETAPPEQLPELLPYLAVLRNGTRDSVDRFAGAQITAISGLPANTQGERIVEWLDAWRNLRSWAKQRDADHIGDIQRRLADPEVTGPMELAAIDALVRIGSLDGVSVILDRLESVRLEVRERAHRALALLTQHSEPFDAQAKPDQRAWATHAWREFWRGEEPALRFRVEWSRLSAALEVASDSDDRAALREKITRLGDPALELVQQILARDRFAFDWVLIRNALVGETRGL